MKKYKINSLSAINKYTLRPPLILICDFVNFVIDRKNLTLCRFLITFHYTLLEHFDFLQYHIVLKIKKYIILYSHDSI